MFPNDNPGNFRSLSQAFDYIRGHGLCSDRDYPYRARQGSCRSSSCRAAATLSKWYKVRAGNEGDLKYAIGCIGPFAVAVDVEDSFRHYRGGIFDNRGCSSDIGKLNHAVLVVGYGNDNGRDYWLVKNSWGRNWGMGGYMKLRRNYGNLCGIATYATCPIV